MIEYLVSADVLANNTMILEGSTFTAKDSHRRMLYRGCSGRMGARSPMCLCQTYWNKRYQKYLRV